MPYCTFEKFFTYCIPGWGARFSIMALTVSARMEDSSSNALPKSNLSFQDLVLRDLIPAVVLNEPQIYPGRSAHVAETEEMSTPTEERGDRYICILFRNIWKHCILDVRITTSSTIHRKPEAVSVFFFPMNERGKQKNHLQACLDQRRHSSLPLWCVM